MERNGICSDHPAVTTQNPTPGSEAKFSCDMKTTDVTYTLNAMEILIVYMIEIFRQIRADLPVRFKVVGRTGKGNLLGVFTVAIDGVALWVSMQQPSVYSLLLVLRRKTPWLSYRFTGMKREEEWTLKSVRSQTSEMESALLESSC